MEKYNQEISRETFEQIENYLLDRMEDRERQLFAQRMAADAQLAAEVALQRRLFTAVETGSLFPDRQPSTSDRAKQNHTRWYAAAAVLLLVGCAVFWFFRKEASLSNTGLYAEYYRPDPGLPVEMGIADSVAYTFYDGMINYKEGNYRAALSKWQKLEQMDSSTDTLQYYIGMAYLNNGDTDKAAVLLEGMTKRADAPFYERANWYLALAYLKKGDKENALLRLNKIRSYPGVVSLINKLME